MGSKIIEEKKLELISEEKQIRQKLQSDCTALGVLVSTNIKCPADIESDLDFSNLLKDKEHCSRVNELLINIKEASDRLDEIKKNLEELDSLKTCPKCGNVVNEDELFCAYCGERLVKKADNANENVCPQCGKPKKSDAAFCAFCGFKFVEQEKQKIEASAERTCVKCGEKLPDDVVFCHICGTRQPE